MEVPLCVHLHRAVTFDLPVLWLGLSCGWGCSDCRRLRKWRFYQPAQRHQECRGREQSKFNSSAEAKLKSSASCWFHFKNNWDSAFTSGLNIIDATLQLRQHNFRIFADSLLWGLHHRSDWFPLLAHTLVFEVSLLLQNNPVLASYFYLLHSKSMNTSDVCCIQVAQQRRRAAHPTRSL